MAKGEKKLTPKQEKFVRAYLACGSQTEAAIEAGYAKESANSAGHVVFHKPQVQAAINKELEKRKKTECFKYDLSREACLNRLGEIIYESKDEKAVISAMNLVAKMEGYFPEEKDVNLKLNQPITVVIQRQGDEGG